MSDSENMEMTADKLKEKIFKWFYEEENKETLRTFLRSLVLSKLNREDLQLNSKLGKDVFDNLDIAMVYLVCDFLAQNHFHYSLSVFSSEISSMKLQGYVADYFSKISYKWNPRKPPMLEYYTVYHIISSLNINPKGLVGSEIINRYYLLSEGSLLKVVSSVIKRFNESLGFNKGNPQKESYDPSLPLNNSYQNKNTNTSPCGKKCSKDLYPLEEMEKYLHKKNLYVQRRISSQRQEFQRCKRILSSCHDSIHLKLNEIHELIEYLTLRKNEINAQLEDLKNQRMLDQTVIKNNDLPSKEELKHVDKAVSVCEVKFSEVKYCQTELTPMIDKCVDTAVILTHVGTQTFLNVETALLDQMTQEKTELIQFIDQQQDRIKILTDKTMDLMNKISLTPNLVSNKDEHESMTEERHICKSVETDLQKDIILDNVITRSTESVTKFYFILDSLRYKSKQVEDTYSEFANIHVN